MRTIQVTAHTSLTSPLAREGSCAGSRRSAIASGSPRTTTAAPMTRAYPLSVIAPTRAITQRIAAGSPSDEGGQLEDAVAQDRRFWLGAAAGRGEEGGGSGLEDGLAMRAWRDGSAGGGGRQA